MCAYHNTDPVSTAAAASHDIVEEDEQEDEDYNDQSDDKDEDGRGILDLDGKGQGVKRKAGMSSAALSPLSLSSLSGASSTPVRQLKSEMMGIQGEQKQRLWVRMKAAKLEEQHVVYQNRALQLERQRFKWLRFCSGKEREMERMRLRNERRRLLHDRMLLLLHHKELTFVDPAANVGEVDPRENLLVG